MSSLARLLPCAILLICGLLPACLGKPAPSRGGSDDGAEAGEGNQGGDPDVEDGSCDAWKVAFCKAVKACSAFETEAECKIRVGYIECKDDAPVGSCQKKIEAALENERCQDLPSVCDPDDMADRSYPTAACRALHEDLCERSFFCGLEPSIESCVAGFELTQPCGDFNAVLPTYEECRKAVQLLECQDPIPSSCQGVFQR